MKKYVLDCGYVQLVESYGSDRGVIEAARMSTVKGFFGWGPSCSKCGISMVVTFEGGISPADYERDRQKGCEHDAKTPGDEKLLRYLYMNTPPHTSPFEFGGMIIEVQAPIFVFREWHRHRTQSYNEMSARYAPLPDMNYVPTVERLMINASKTNKQAGTVAGSADLTLEAAEAFRLELANEYKRQEDFYQRSLAAGVPKELARVDLPVGRYSRMRASANLLNWLKFLTLRMDENAQWEIRQYANAVGEMIAQEFPRTWELFAEGRAR
jgi:thymidylate synthase (FAD)